MGHFANQKVQTNNCNALKITLLNAKIELRCHHNHVKPNEKGEIWGGKELSSPPHSEKQSKQGSADQSCHRFCSGAWQCHSDAHTLISWNGPFLFSKKAMCPVMRRVRATQNALRANIAPSHVVCPRCGFVGKLPFNFTHCGAPRFCVGGGGGPNRETTSSCETRVIFVKPRWPVQIANGYFPTLNCTAIHTCESSP